MKPAATKSIKPNKGNNSNSHGAKFAKVLDGRKNPIRGLWICNRRYYARLSLESSEKQVRRVPLLDDEQKPIEPLAHAQEALAALKTDRNRDSLRHRRFHHRNHFHRPDGPVHMHRQTFPRVFIQQSQRSEARPILRLVLHKVPVPDVIGPLRPLLFRGRNAPPPQPLADALDAEGGIFLLERQDLIPDSQWQLGRAGVWKGRLEASLAASL
jgi:hypothetical protein